MSTRAYSLELGEPVPNEIARIARGRIDDALDELSGATESSPEDAVHGARKDMKKLRALLRLVRGEIGEKVYRREMATFRDAGRELSGVRDADVMLATLESLELPASDGGPLRQALEAHKLQTSAGARGQAAAAATELLTEARGRVADWPLEGEGFEVFEDGLRRMYRQGRSRFRAARKDPTAERLHEWRKRSKDLWYHCTILEESWQPVMKALGDEAHELSNRLGDDHDLAVLVALVARPRGRRRPGSAGGGRERAPRRAPGGRVHARRAAVRRQARGLRGSHRALVGRRGAPAGDGVLLAARASLSS